MKNWKNYTRLILTAAMLLSEACVWAVGTKTVYNIDVKRTIDQTSASVLNINPSVLGGKLNCVIANAMTSGTVKFHSINPTTGKYTQGSTLSPYGHYFNANGLAVAVANKKKAISSQFNGSSAFTINVIEGMVEDGNIYTWKQALVNMETADTLQFDFEMTIGNEQSVSSDIPLFNHRADKIDA